jgi:hypothetical protein
LACAAKTAWDLRLAAKISRQKFAAVTQTLGIDAVADAGG